MSKTIEYFFAPHSPWAYLGHARLAAIARAADAAVDPRPVDFGRIFPVSGGLPLAKRAAQRQAYRMVDLKRFSDWLGVPLHLQPKFFPVAGDDAARLIIAVREHDGSDAAMALSGRVMTAVWAEERDIASTATLAELLAEAGLDAARLEDSRGATVQQRYADDTQRAIELGVFGAPSYVIDGEIFWGQDRLDFVERRLARA